MPIIKTLKRIVKKVMGERFCDILRYDPVVVSRREYNQVFLPLDKCRSAQGARDFDDQYWAAVLRQMAHCLDKGCLNEYFESSHSQAYHRQAKEALAKIETEDGRSDPSVRWAQRRIEEYERMQEEAGFPEVLAPPICKLSYGDLIDLMQSRRSIRNFLEREVNSETLERIIAAADWAPSSCNRQTTKVFATNDPELVAACMRQCNGATCFGKFVPIFFSYCSDIRSYSFPSEIVTPYIDVALGAQNSNLIANTLGISLTMLTCAPYSEQSDRTLRSLLSIPDYCLIVVNAVGGYPSFMGECPSRKSPKIICNIK